MYTSELIEVRENDKIKIDMMYPKLGMKNKIDKCYLVKEVYNKLLEASSYLPRGYSFKIWDAYRPFSLQEELYDKSIFSKIFGRHFFFFFNNKKNKIFIFI